MFKGTEMPKPETFIMFKGEAFINLKAPERQTAQIFKGFDVQKAGKFI